MKYKKNEIAEGIQPAIFFMATFLKHNIKDYRQGDIEAKRFLFEGRQLRTFLETFGFKHLNIDILRRQIRQGEKLVDIF